MDSFNVYRGLQQNCKERTSISTTFNNDDRIPTYTGIMFEVFPNMDLELLTLEMDVRIDGVGGVPDLWVEVYTLVGSYELFGAYGAERWSLVSETNAVLLAGGQGAIIPTSEFNKVEMKAGERRSFYVTFRQSYIDFTADALQKTGEIQMTTPELDISVGVGFHEYKFPGDYDRTLDPQFAGVLHLRRTGECSLFVKNTEVTYNYLVEAEPTPEISSQLVEAVQEAIKSLMENDSILLSYQRQFGLVQLTQPRSAINKNSGACPHQWAICPDRYFNIIVSFEHNDKLDEGELKYQFYRHYGKIDDAVKERITGHNLLYVGLASVSADITMSLSGTPENSIMDSVQVDYFEEVVVSFLQARIGPTASIYDLVIDNQSRSRKVRHARALQGSDLMVTGKLYGAQGTFYSAENFRSEVENTFRNGQDLFLQSLSTNGLRPSDVSEGGGIELFNSITSVGGNIRVDETPQQSAPGVQGPVTKSANIAVVVGVVLTFAVVCLVVWLVSHFWRLYQQKDDKQRMKEYREEREKIDRMNWQRQIDDEYDEVFGSGNDRQEADDGLAEASLDALRYLESITETNKELNPHDLDHNGNHGTLRRSSSFNDSEMSSQRIPPPRSRSCESTDVDLSQYEMARTGGLYKGVVEPKNGQKPQLPKSSLDKFLQDERVGSIRRGNSRSVSSSAISIGSYAGANPPTRSRSGPVLGYPGPQRTMPPRGHLVGRNGPGPRLPPGRSSSGPVLVQNQPSRVGPPRRAPPGRAKSYDAPPTGLRPAPLPPGTHPRFREPPLRIPPDRSQSLNQTRPPACVRPHPHGIHPTSHTALPLIVPTAQLPPSDSKDPESLRLGPDSAAQSRMKLVSGQGPDNPPVPPPRPQYTPPPPTMIHKQIGTRADVLAQQKGIQASSIPSNTQKNSVTSESCVKNKYAEPRNDGPGNTVSDKLNQQQVEAASEAATDSPPRAETPPDENSVDPAGSPATSTSSLMPRRKESEHKDKKKKEKKSKKEKKEKKEKKRSKENKPQDDEGQQKVTIKDGG